MSTIVLDLDNDIIIDSENQLSVKISEDPGNTLVLKSDGLYAHAPKGVDGRTGQSYPRQQQDGIRIGYCGPFNLTDGNLVDNRVSVTNIVHRTFDSNDAEGSSLQGFRPNVDYVLVGDMYRVPNGDKYDYYLITRTSSDNDGSPGNIVKSSSFIGTWGD